MGPIALFDKSFLQSLNIDESVWFDNFFLPNISPLFYIETLADLDKEVKRGRTPEQVVGDIAAKTPEMGGAPNVHHMDLIISNLLGFRITMDGRPVVAGGKPVNSRGKVGVNFEVSSEAKAYSRWQDGEYLEIEREFAKSWREYLKSINFDNSPAYAKKIGIDISICKNMDDAFKAATEIVSSNRKPYDLMKFVLTTLAIPRQYHQKIIERYQISGLRSLNEFAPYVAHVVKVEIFFHICVSRGFISSKRPSNKIDIAYLYYLPFCSVFISGDKLHRSSAPYFMKESQEFVWGPDLKSDLKSLNEFYSKLPDEVKNKGIFSFAKEPPTEGSFLTTALWDKALPGWRSRQAISTPLPPKANDGILEEFKEFTEAPEIKNPENIPDSESIDAMSMQRAIRKKKGTWYQLPKDLETANK